MALQANVSQKFRIERTVTNDVTLLELHGIVDEAFEGRKAADAVRTKKLVLDFSHIRRFASWGMAQWTEFARVSGAKDLYIVECSIHAVSQFHLVTGLLAHAKLVSFYTAFRCGKCGEESESLFVVPSDRDQLYDSEQACPTCGGSSRMDKYSAQLCASIAEQAPYDIDDEVVAFLRSRYRYNVTPDLQRFRGGRAATKDYVYLRLTGNVNGVQEALARSSEMTTVLDLAGLTIPSRDAKVFTPWRAYLRAALPNVTSLQLLDCPVGFLDHALVPDDLQKVKVRTFALEYACPSCRTMAIKTIDVAKHLEHLVEGRLPAETCPSCAQAMDPLVSPDLALILRRLPARENDAALDKFITKSRGVPAQELADGLAERAKEEAPKAAGGPARTLYIASALMVLVTAALVALGLGLWKRDGNNTTTTDTDKIIAPRPLPTVQRPDWILSDSPLSGFCHDMVNRLMCVGVSGYRRNQEEGLADANDAAMDELLHTVALKITDPMFKDGVLPKYNDARTTALATLQVADTDRTTASYAQASEAVRAARKRVVELLRASGGAAVPSQRSDWYWEEYAIEKGAAKTETLVFVRYDIPLDVVKALLEKYTTAVPIVEGTTAVTAFPAVAWGNAAFAGGAMIAQAGPPFSSAGLAPKHLVTAVGEHKVVDAPDLAKQIQQATGEVKLNVIAGDAAPKVITVKR